MKESTLTDRGQVSVPASLRKAMDLHPGQQFSWEQVSDREIRVTIAQPNSPGPLSVLGYARKLRASPRTTAQWMKELRAGD